MSRYFATFAWRFDLAGAWSALRPMRWLRSSTTCVAMRVARRRLLGTHWASGTASLAIGDRRLALAPSGDVGNCGVCFALSLGA